MPQEKIENKFEYLLQLRIKWDRFGSFLGGVEERKVYLLKKTVSERKDSSPSPELMLAKITPTRATEDREAPYLTSLNLQ